MLSSLPSRRTWGKQRHWPNTEPPSRISQHCGVSKQCLSKNSIFFPTCIRHKGSISSTLAAARCDATLLSLLFFTGPKRESVGSRALCELSALVCPETHEMEGGEGAGRSSVRVADRVGSLCPEARVHPTWAPRLPEASFRGNVPDRTDYLPFNALCLPKNASTPCPVSMRLFLKMKTASLLRLNATLVWKQGE